MGRRAARPSPAHGALGARHPDRLGRADRDDGGERRHDVVRPRAGAAQHLGAGRHDQPADQRATEDGEWVPAHDYPIFTDRRRRGAARADPGRRGGDAHARRARPREPARRALPRDASCSAPPASPTSSRSTWRPAGSSARARWRTTPPVVVVNYALATELSATRSPLTLVGREIRVNGRIAPRDRRAGADRIRGPQRSRRSRCYAPIRSATALLAAAAARAIRAVHPAARHQRGVGRRRCGTPWPTG